VSGHLPPLDLYAAGAARRIGGSDPEVVLAASVDKGLETLMSVVIHGSSFLRRTS
jgi:hypothetical protein